MLNLEPPMLSYSDGYSIEKGHDIGWSVMACELVGVAGFEPAASSSRTPPSPEQGAWQAIYVQVTTVGAATLTVSDPTYARLAAPVWLPKSDSGFPGYLNRISSSGLARPDRFRLDRRARPVLRVRRRTRVELQPQLQPIDP